MTPAETLDAPAGAPPAALETPPAAPRRRRALVVEPDDAVRAVAAKALRRAGWDAVACADGPAALAELDRGFDCVLFEHGLPAPGGPEFFRSALAARPELDGRFLMMSGDPHGKPRAFARAVGIPVLGKPFLIEALHAAVGALGARR